MVNPLRSSNLSQILQLLKLFHFMDHQSKDIQETVIHLSHPLVTTQIIYNGMHGMPKKEKVKQKHNNSSLMMQLSF